MTSSEIEPRREMAPAGQDGARDVVDGWLAVVSDVIRLANVISETDFVPETYRGNPPAVAGAILAGRELGIGPMTSLRHVQIVKGTPSLSAEYKRARVLAAGHDFDVLELTTTRCRVAGRRRGSVRPPLEITFTMDDARRAGLLAPSRSGKPGAWQTRPRRMLFARASTELCDFLFADAVNGLPTTELLSDGGDGYAGYDEPPADRKRERKAQRGPLAAVPASPEPRPEDPPEPEAPAAGPPPEPPPEPPLPGEDDEGSDMASPGQAGIIVAHFSRLGYDDEDRDKRLAHTARLAGSGPIGSTRELTSDQARAVMDTLARCKDRKTLLTLLTAAEDDGGQP